MFNPTIYENTRPDGIAVMEVEQGKPQNGREPRLFVPLKRTELRGEVMGPLAALHLTHVYGYTRAQSDKTLEAVYRFPLPGDAAVTGVTVRFGEVEIQAELQAREQAEAEYEKARQRGQQAALTTRESPDVFTLRVAGLQPDQDVTVETSYVQLARAEGLGWSLRVPLTTAPRYTRSDEWTGRHTHGQPLALLRDPGHRFSLDLVVRGADEVDSPTHALATESVDGGQRVRLQDGKVLPDRDCVLRWQPHQEKRQASLQVLLHDDLPSALVYFLALVAPPVTHQRGKGVSREVILLVDHSGSMTGPKWEAADWAVERFLSDLGPDDAFTLCLFHNTTRWFSTATRPATPDVVAEAIQFLKEHKDSGGTELGVALEQALNVIPAPDPLDSDIERARHVLIVTDAQVTDEARILRLADQEAELPGRRRISVLCIDAAPNSYLVHELAERGGGVARFLTSSPEEEDITTALDDVLAEWGEPVLSDLRLFVNHTPVEASGQQVMAGDEPEWQAIDLGALPYGRAVWVAGRVARDWPELIFRLMPKSGEPLDIEHIDMTEELPQRPALKALFGARRVAGLEYLIHAGYAGEELADRLRRLGYDPEKVLAAPTGQRPKVYAENVRADAERLLRDLLTREALDYGLVSSETAFVAIRKEQGQPVQGTVVVANALPTGWSEEFVSPMPFTGATRRGAAGVSRAALSFSTAAPRGLAEILPSMPAFQVARMEAPARGGVTGDITVFSGEPRSANGETLLFDSTQAEDVLPDAGIIRRLTVRFANGMPDPAQLGHELELWLYVGDPATPRARVRLADLVRQRGERPLNIARQPGEMVRLMLRDPTAAWALKAPRLEVVLEIA
jgi:Ca-activated chloride channel family protein